MTPGQRTAVAPADPYLDLMKRVLTRYRLEQGYQPLPAWRFWNRVPKGRQLAQLIDRSPLQLARRVQWNAKAGRTWSAVVGRLGAERRPRIRPAV